jgi:tetratricopeptide (TPR) repeat protein
MPYENSRRDRTSSRIDFDQLYRQLICPAVKAAGLEPIRADQELQGGIFHKTMFERLADCTYAVADLSLANPNVFYELGIRHALRPWTTVLMFQAGLTLPLDVALGAAMTYPEDVLEDSHHLATSREVLTARLQAAEEHRTDSPVFQLVTGLPTREVDHRRADVLLEAATRENDAAQRVVLAERQGPDALTALRRELGDVRNAPAEVVSALLMSFRAQEQFAEMIELIAAADPDFAEVWVVREQLALALARVGQFERAFDLLRQLISTRPNSESYGLLGGAYRRQADALERQGAPIARVRGARQRAIQAYRSGFECDWRDPYPGINAVMLAAQQDLPATLDDPFLAAVEYAVSRRIAADEPEYWDYACAVQLAVVTGRTKEAEEHLPDLLYAMTQPFHRTSTLQSLIGLRKVSVAHGQADWHDWLIAEVAAT